MKNSILLLVVLVVLMARGVGGARWQQPQSFPRRVFAWYRAGYAIWPPFTTSVQAGQPPKPRAFLSGPPATPTATTAARELLPEGKKSQTPPVNNKESPASPPPLHHYHHQAPPPPPKRSPPRHYPSPPPTSRQGSSQQRHHHPHHHQPPPPPPPRTPSNQEGPSRNNHYQPPPPPAWTPRDPGDCSTALIYVEGCIRDLITSFFAEKVSMDISCCRAVSGLSDGCFDNAFTQFSDAVFRRSVRQYCSPKF